MLRSTVVTFASLILLLTAGATSADPLLLVVNKSDHNVQVINGTTYKTIELIRTGEGPHELAISPDGRYAYVGDFEGSDNTVSVIDLKQMARVKSINMKPNYGPHSIAVAPDGKKMYVTVEKSRAINEVDLTSYEITRTFATDESLTHMCALSIDGTMLFGVSARSGNINVFDLGTGRRIRNVYVSRGVEGIDVTPDGSEIWVTSRRAQAVAVIDVETLRMVHDMARTGNPIRVKITPDGTQAWVTCPTMGIVMAYDTATREEISGIRTGDGPIGLLIEPSGHRVFVANQNDGDVAVIDRKEMKVVERITVGARPDGMAWVP